jgi:Putative beta-barrel porin 2
LGLPISRFGDRHQQSSGRQGLRHGTMMTTSSIRRLSAALSMLAPAVNALAQPVSAPIPVEDVLSVDAAASVEHHSNIFRVTDGASDTVVRALLGVRFERDISLQRITAYATVEPAKYLNFSSYDYFGYTAGGTWAWEVGRPLFGEVTARFARFQTPFDAIPGGQNNLQTLQFGRALFGFRMTQNWSVIGAVDDAVGANSLASQAASDFNRVGAELGVRRVAAGSATDVDFVWRHENGNYPNQQVYDANGNLLPAAVDNAYSQDAVLMRITYRPTDTSRISGNIGYTRRSYQNVSQRDFSGVTGGMDFEWPLSGAVTMRAAIFRTIDSATLPTANYIDAMGIAFRPTWQIGARTSIDAVLAVAARSYKGDPGFVLDGTPVRKDNLNEVGLRLNYEVARRVFVFADAARIDRTSNYAQYAFTDNWFGIGVRAAF